MASKPLAGEVDPNNPVTAEFREHWYKLCAVLMDRLGADTVEITAEDVEKLGDNKTAIILDARDHKLVLRKMSMEDAIKFHREQTCQA